MGASRIWEDMRAAAPRHCIGFFLTVVLAFFDRLSPGRMRRRRRWRRTRTSAGQSVHRRLEPSSPTALGGNLTPPPLSSVCVGHRSIFEFPDSIKKSAEMIATLDLELAEMRRLWDVNEGLQTFITEAQNILWREIVPDNLDEEIKQHMKNVKSLHKLTRWCDAFKVRVGDHRITTVVYFT
jgi:hypothetical protein